MFEHECTIGYLYGPSVVEPRLVTEDEYTHFAISHQPRTEAKGNGQLHILWYLNRFNYCPICGRELIYEGAR